MIRAMWVCAVIACAGCPGVERVGDSGVDAPLDACALVPKDFFGESCKSDPFPANTVCHSDEGWCINDVCRPQCNQLARRCCHGAVRIAPAGACYCEPD